MTLPPPPPPPPNPSASSKLLFFLPLTFSFLCLPKSPSPRSSSPLRLLPHKSPMDINNNHPSLRPLSFSSPSSLSDFLKPRVPTLPSWGAIPGSKTLHNLWLEISQGESSILPSSPTPTRSVNVAALKIRNPSDRRLILLEARQALSDGTVRERNRPLSEKMRPGESVEEAAVRAVREELGEGVKARVRMESYHVREEERGSVSYPGLPAMYVLHTVEVEVEGVPEEGEFSTEESGEEVEGGDGCVFVIRHFWRWVEDDGSF